MAGAELGSLLAVFEAVRPALTAPGFRNFLVLVTGWLLTGGPHAVTEALVQARIAERRHHEAFHRFFSRGTWSPDEIGRLLFELILGAMPRGCPLRVVVDDTLASKKGPKVFGIGSHLDAVRSTKRQKIFCFGHCWVTLAVIMPVPFSRRTWALPVLFRLYRTHKECERRGEPHRKKTELARELLDVLAGWSGERRVELSMDSAYCNDTVLRQLPARFAVFGAMRPDAVLTGLPRTSRRHRNGRPRVRGAALPKPEALARSQRIPWQRTQALLYGKLQTVDYKLCEAQWYRACGVRLLRIVVVRVDEGRIGVRVFFSTDPRLSAREILEGYAQRWAIEICFRDLKQHFGFADSSARKRTAVERTAPFAAFSYSLLVIWAIRGAYRLPVAAPPIRPWYAHKRGLSAADLLRAAQRVLAPVEVLDLLKGYDNLKKARALADPRSAAPLRRAA
jgi:hypothetical protein